MPLKYNPKVAPSEVIAKVMASLSRECLKKGMMASLIISDGGHGEFFLTLDPEWSCCSMKRLPSGDISVSVEMAGRKKTEVERTVNALATLFRLTDEHRSNLTAVMADVQKVIGYAHFGEECHNSTADPPDPAKIPETLEEAADLVYATMDRDKLAYAQVTPLYAALPHLHMGFAMKLRNNWGLWKEDCPLAAHVRLRLGLFGHADDLTVLIFTRLWSKVRGDSEEEANEFLRLEAEGMKDYWRKEGRNPETGEKGLIV